MKTTPFVGWMLSGLFIFAAGCNSKKETLEPTPAKSSVLVSYAQTYCADRWGQAPTAPQLQTVATAYLLQQGITLSNAKASAKSPAAVCNACTCTTGIVLEGEVSPADLPAVLALGFTKL